MSHAPDATRTRTVPLDAAEWARADAALDVLLPMRPAERMETLESLRQHDPKVAAEVRSLLTAADAVAAIDATHNAAPNPSSDAGTSLGARTGALLESRAIEHCRPWLERHETPASDADRHRDTVIGRYRLLEPIGRGGMGEVWLAERADGAFEQRVAIKLVKRGMDSDETLARFLRERQILARLEHPNIARLLDGGVHGDGRPYFVMEYVDGVPCTDYCNARGLTTDQRLEVFAAVCRAVHVAHQNLVVHRDIKPSNVLVTHDGAVKLLDFGIARLLTTGSGTDTRPDWSRAVTPAYASPEQRRGAPITTASDVYQLGLLLYELLTRERLVPGNDSEHFDRLETRRSAPVELRDELRAVLLQALAEIPSDRYGSADALAHDVQRYRLGLGVTARGVSRRERAARYIRRHRSRLLTMTMFAVVVVAFGAIYLDRLRTERDRALVQATTTAQSAELLAQFFDGWNPDAADRSQVSASDLLDRASQHASMEFTSNPEVRASLMSLLGQLQSSVGRFAQAESLLDQAERYQREHGANDSELAATLQRRGRLRNITGRHEDAERDIRAAVAIKRRTLGPTHIETLRAERALATELRPLGRIPEAERMLRDVMRRAQGDGDALVGLRSELASDLGYMLFEQSRYEEARALLEDALAVQRRMFGARHMVTLITMRELGSTYRDMGFLDRSEQLYREALKTSRALYGDDHRQTATARLVLAHNLHRTWQLDEMRALAQESLDRIARLPIDDRAGFRELRNQWTTLLGVVELDLGHDAMALPILRMSLAELRAIYPGGTDEETDIANRIAYITRRRGDPTADAAYRDAMAVRARRKPDAPDYVTDGIHFLAWTMDARGDHASARALYARADALYRRTLPPSHAYRAFVEAARHGQSRA